MKLSITALVGDPYVVDGVVHHNRRCGACDGDGTYEYCPQHISGICPCSKLIGQCSECETGVVVESGCECLRCVAMQAELDDAEAAEADLRRLLSEALNAMQEDVNSHDGVDPFGLSCGSCEAGLPLPHSLGCRIRSALRLDSDNHGATHGN